MAKVQRPPYGEALRKMKASIHRPSAPTIFPAFRKLLVEICIDIWELHCFETRVIDLVVLPKNPTDIEKNKVGSFVFTRYTKAYAFQTRTAPPTILPTTSEAREVGLKFYTLDFGREYRSKGQLYVTTPQVYVNVSTVPR